MPRKSKRRYEPSDSIKKSISTWEGIAMDGPSIDPLSGKLVKQNNSFEEEARLFESKIPKELQDTILNNQSLSDNLFSYSYNVGSGNFEKRVVPALKHYYNNIFGRAKEVTDSMYGNGDSVLSGLAKRRVTEKNGVYDNLPRIIGTLPAQALEYQDVIKTYRPAITPSNTVRDTKKAMQDKVDFHNFMDSISIQNNLPPAYTSKSNIHSEGGYMYKPKDAWEALSMPEKAEMMKVAVRNGITNLQDIREKYNEFAKGGSKKKLTSGWYQQHQNRWYNFLKSKGLNDADSARLSGFFTAQDDLESAGGKSNAAREKNNFGGMQRGGKNIRYNTVEDYMQDKWKMMNSKFKSALGAKNIDEYATILGNPETAGKGYLYYVTDKVKYDPKSPQWKAAQRQHMQNYINGMRSRAGMETVRFNNQPIASAKPSITPTTPIAPIQSQDSPVYAESSIPFTLFNPEAFFSTPETYQQPVAVEELEAQEPVAISPYSPEELDRQERMDKLSAFNNMLRMTSPQGNGNVFLDAIGMLTGNTFANGGGIHIKPSKKGTFTAAASKHGMGVQEFASKVLANKENYSPAMVKKANFARNASKWHGLGGNLFDNGGSYSYTKPLDNVFVDSEGNLLDPSVPSAKGAIQLPEVIATTRDPRKPVPTAFDGSITPWFEVGEILAKPLNVFSPSQQFGAVADAVQGKRNYFESVFNGNSGFFTDQYAQEHPYLTMAGNLGGDILSGAALSKVPKLAASTYKGIVQPGMRLFNSPLTGNWIKIGNREYRLNTNSLGANGTPLESKVVNSQGNVTDNLLKWLGRPKGYKPDKPISQKNSLYFDFKPIQGEMARIWKDKGVNLDRIGVNDIEEALKKRWDELVSSRQDRHTIIRSAGNDTYFLHDLIPDEKAPYGWRSIGTTQLSKDATGNMHMEDIANSTESIRMGKPATEHRVQERALNAAIKASNQEGGKGVVTGKMWLSAPKQQHVVQKYHDRKVMGNTGQHSNVNMVEERINADIRRGLPVTGEEETLAKSMLDLRRADNKEIKTLLNQPFWLLRTPTYDVPVKSTLFDPTIIDRFGKMHIDWNDPNIFREIIYPTLIGAGLYGTKE